MLSLSFLIIVRYCLLMQARAKELRLELLNSQRLKAFFEEHPGEACHKHLA